MQFPSTKLLKFLNDKYAFPFIQILLFCFFIFTLIKALPKEGVTLSVERGAASMAIFYGFYATASGLMVALCLSTEAWIAKNYRVFWILLDVSIIFYVCLLNVWFRNKLLDWAYILTRVDM